MAEPADIGPVEGPLPQGRRVAAANWFALYQTDCRVEVSVQSGRLAVATASQDMGTGSRTVLARTVAWEFGVRPSDVDVYIGDSSLTRGPTSGGSRTTATVAPAARDAAHRLRDRLLTQTRDQLALPRRSTTSRAPSSSR